MLKTKIKEIRREKGLTQTFMANALNISQAAFQKIETGQIRLRKPVLEKIATIFEMSVDEIEAYQIRPSSISNQTSDHQSALEIMKIIDPTLKELIQSYKSRIEYLEKENTLLLEKLVR